MSSWTSPWCTPRVSMAGRRWKKARDRKSTRLNSSHGYISYAVFCLKKKNLAKSRTDLQLPHSKLLSHTLWLFPPHQLQILHSPFYYGTQRWLTECLSFSASDGDTRD